MSFHSLSNPFVPLSWRGTETFLSVNSLQFHDLKSGNVPHFTSLEVATSHYSFLFSLVISLAQRNSLFPSFCSCFDWGAMLTPVDVHMFSCSQFCSAGSWCGYPVVVLPLKYCHLWGNPSCDSSWNHLFDSKSVPMSGLYHFKAYLGVSHLLSVTVAFQPFDLQIDAEFE